ncbi:MAG: hypothetical protein NVSMB4_16720 [Acidimicrobiales bacterium]
MLDNAGWGFESNCFVCERSNAQGLQIPFAHDEDRDAVVADFSVGADFSGAPAYVHGGVVSAVMDEAMAWAAIAVGGAFALTSELSLRFLRPVRVGRMYHVEATLTETTAQQIQAQAHLTDERERVCATATATLVPLGAAHAADAVGAEITGPDAAFLVEGTGRSE